MRGKGSSRSSRAPCLLPRAPERGLTLVEVLISIAILASASVLVLQALMRGAYAVALAQNKLRAYAFASAKMADLEISVTRGVVPKTDGTFGFGHDRFSWHVDTAIDPGAPQLELVTLTVEFFQGLHPYESQIGGLMRRPETASK